MNLTRKSVLLLLVAAALGALAGCNREKKRVIAVIPKGQAHLFWQSVHAGAVKAARESNVEIFWNGPASEADVAAQLQIVERMVSRPVDAVVVAPTDKTALSSVVDRASSQKIPVVIFDSPVETQNFVAQVATDNYKAGETAAARMGEVLGGKGKIAIVMTQAGGASTMAREAGFEDKLKKDFPGIEIVARQYGQSDYAKSLQAAENMLAAHPDLSGMFASNESGTVGAAKAVGSRGTKVKIVGFDFNPIEEEGLRSGLIDSVVVQDPFRMGYDSVKAAVAALDGKQVEKIQNLPPRLVQKADLDKPDVQAQLKPDLKKYLD